MGIRIILIGCLTVTAAMLSGCKEKAGYSGEDLSGKAEIFRYELDEAPLLGVMTGEPWTLYSGPSVEKISDKPVLEGERDGMFPVSQTPAGERVYFMIKTGRGTALMAERHLPLEGGFNFRDLGGYRTAEGKYVKWGKLFRSDDLSGLTDADLNYLASIPIKSIVDFRAQEEEQRAQDKLPSSLKVKYDLRISPGDMSQAASLSDMEKEQLEGFMKQINVDFVTDPEFIARYREFFNVLQNNDSAPLVFHCSAGKDRTGMGAALILYALGVDEETIMEDYLLSNRYIVDKYCEDINECPPLIALFTVDASYLQSGIDRIKQDHGTVENFLEKELGVDIPAFRRMYLY